MGFDADGGKVSRKMIEYAKQVARVQAMYTLIGEKTKKKNDHFLFIARSNGEFTGNVKYLFLHFVKNVPEVKSCFLTQHRDVYHQLRNAKLPVMFYPSDHEEKIAEYGTVIVDSISFRRHLYAPLLAKARQVQLWHGVGNKKIGFLLEGLSCLEGKDQTLIEDHSGYDIIISTSPFYTDEVFRKSMDAKQFATLGYPRTDVFFRQLDKNSMIGCDVKVYAKIKAARKKGPVILFTPTFRDNGVNPLTQDVLDLRILQELLEQKNAHLLIKTHTRSPVTFGALPDNVTVCDAASDIYPFMPLADMMITDYSSIFTEYLLLDRPVIFFWSDFEKYMAKDRGFQFPFEDMCPGPKCRTAEELYRTIDETLAGVDDWKGARRKMRDKSFSHANGGACERITKLLVGDAG